MISRKPLRALPVNHTRPTRTDARRHAAPGTRARIVLVLPGAGSPTASLRRAAALARLQGSELCVLRVLPRLSGRGNAETPSNELFEAVRTVERILAEERTTRRWMSEVLADGAPPTTLRLRVGEVVEQVARYAAEVGAELIVVPSTARGGGSVVRDLVRATGLAVFVTRRPTDEGTAAGAELADSARERRAPDADCVVVGTRPRSWISRLVRSVAERPVDEAKASAPMTPLEARA